MSEPSTSQEQETPTSPLSDLQAANALIEQQNYLLNRQNDVTLTLEERNKALVQLKCQCERENHKLRKELEGYKKSKLWTLVSSFLPTISFGDDLFDSEIHNTKGKKP